MLGLTPAAATLPLFLPQAPPDKVSGLFHAATLLAQMLGQGRALDSRALRSAMEAAFGGTDAEGAWVWKDAYEALEAAQVLFLRKFGGAMRSRAGSPTAMLEMLIRLAGRLASQTRRSEESEHFQQFSTPLALGFVVAEAAALTPSDVVLEPSAGTGLLAIFAELAKARLALNEIAETRAGLLGRLFRDVAVSRLNAEQIHDHLDPVLRPSVVLMNPPFSASPHVQGRFAEATIRHLGSALARLAEGGRLVAITGHNVGPDQPAWREAFVRLQQKGRVVFTATIAGRAYVRHGIPGLRRYARALTRNPARADDLVQNCLVRAVAKQHLWQEGTDLRAWLFTILHNQHVNDVRRSAREGATVAVEELASVLRAEPNAVAALELRDLHRAMGRLPEEQRQVILLAGLEGMRYEQVAQILNIPIGTVRSRLSRGRDTLRLLMGMPGQTAETLAHRNSAAQTQHAA